MVFHAGELEVQERAGVSAIAAEVGTGINDSVAPAAIEFLAHRRFVLLGTVDAAGGVWVSIAAGEPGFVTVPDPRVVKIAALPPADDPVIENLASDAHVALLAIDLLNPRRLRINGRGLIRGGVIQIRTDQVYGNCRRYIQERIVLGERAAGAAHEIAPVRSRSFSAAQRELVNRADTFFIATDHPERGADVSHRGGAPGFVRVLDERRLAFPDYNGNGMFNTLGNLAIAPRAGLMFIDFESGRTLQLSGRGSIDWDPGRARSFSGAERVVDFTLDEVLDRERGFPLATRFRQASRFNPKP